MPLQGDSYCGLYCGACSVARCGETGQADAFADCLSQVPREALRCGGCKTDNVYAGCRLCKLKKCAVERGLENCSACADYPCKAYKSWSAFSRILPHVQESRANLDSLKRNGRETWLAGQKKRWACPSCGGPLSWYAQICPWCLSTASARTFTMVGWRRILSRFLLLKVYKKSIARLKRECKKALCNCEISSR